MKKNLLLLLFISASALVKAQWTNNTFLNTVVRDSIGTGEETPLSASRSDGKTYVSFFEQYNGSYQMRMQLLDSGGNKLWTYAGLIVSSFPQSTALYRYDLKVDQNDNAIVAFQDTRTGGNLNIVAYKIDGSGNFLWGANGIQLIDPVSTEGLGPAIGITNSNNVIIGWAADASPSKWIAFEKISAAGTILWSSQHRIIDSTNVKKYSRPTMTASGSDDFVMLYAQETGTVFPPTSKMYAQHYDTSGTGVWASSVLVSSKAIPFFFFQKAVSDLNGGFYAAFNTSNASFPSQTDVYFQHVDSAGMLWNAVGNIACALPSSQHFTPAARFDAANNSFWILIQVTDISQGMSGVYIQKSDAAGNVLLGANAAQLVGISAAYYNPNDFTITSDGVISIYTVGSNALSQTLAAIKNDFSGALMWGGNPVTICSNVSGKSRLSTGLFLNNQVVAVWSDTRNDYGVYAQNVTNDGLIGIITAAAEIKNKNTLSVYPNPFENKLTISTPQFKEPSILKVFSVLGKEIYSQIISSANSELITTNFTKGVYFIHFNNYFVKVIKQ